jgi:glycine hydroxymethyltransferase
MTGAPIRSALFQARLDKADPELAALILREGQRQQETINLIASESYCPRATIDAEASILTVKNATGYVDTRAVAGCETFDEIERLACRRACALFGAERANLQALASTVANIAVLRGLLRPGDRLLALDESAGGHHSHGAAEHLSGIDYRVETFGADEARGRIDLDHVADHARRFRPRAIIAGSTHYPRAIDFQGLAEIAAAVDAYLIADIAHVAGLVVAGLHENPVAVSDVVTTSTHKTLCGPRTGGVILSRAQHEAPVARALFPGLQGAPGAHIIAGRAVLFELVARPAFKETMDRVVANARAFAERLLERGIPLYLGGTDTHMVVLDLGGRSGKAVERHLAAHGILGNAVPLPDGGAPVRRAGLRLGSVAMTLRGVDEAAFRALADAVARIVQADEGHRDDRLAGAVADLARAHPIPDDMAPTRADHAWNE